MIIKNATWTQDLWHTQQYPLFRDWGKRITNSGHPVLQSKFKSNMDNLVKRSYLKIKLRVYNSVESVAELTLNCRFNPPITYTQKEWDGNTLWRHTCHHGDKAQISTIAGTCGDEAWYRVRHHFQGKPKFLHNLNVWTYDLPSAEAVAISFPV